tara:strand:+ start:138 stop:524 length:387 start_codon:yes stop_codon:yes gene_type:complete
MKQSFIGIFLIISIIFLSCSEDDGNDDYNEYMRVINNFDSLNIAITIGPAIFDSVMAGDSTIYKKIDSYSNDVTVNDSLITTIIICELEEGGPCPTPYLSQDQYYTFIIGSDWDWAYWSDSWSNAAKK